MRKKGSRKSIRRGKHTSRLAHVLVKNGSTAAKRQVAKWQLGRRKNQGVCKSYDNEP